MVTGKKKRQHSAKIIYCLGMHSFSKWQGWHQKFSDRGAGASDKGAEIAEKAVFRTSFCQISFDRIPRFPLTGGGGLELGDAWFANIRGGAAGGTIMETRLY